MEDAIVFNLDQYLPREHIVQGFIDYCRQVHFLPEDAKVYIIETDDPDLLNEREHPVFETLFEPYEKGTNANMFAGVFPLDRDPVILWYPSSDFDLHPLVHLHPGNCQRFGMPVPDLFIFNSLGSTVWDELRDSWLSGRDLHGRFLFQDNFTKISICSFLPLEFVPERIAWHCGLPFNFPETYEDRELPFQAALIRILADSDRFGACVQNLLFMELENSVFERCILREHYLQPTYFWSTEDGCGFGGNRRCENDTRRIDKMIAHRDMRPDYWITDHVYQRDLNRKLWVGYNQDEEYSLNASLVGLRNAVVEELPFSMVKAFRLRYPQGGLAHD
jgi:hypothetical protein